MTEAKIILLHLLCILYLISFNSALTAASWRPKNSKSNSNSEFKTLPKNALRGESAQMNDIGTETNRLKNLSNLPAVSKLGFVTNCSFENICIINGNCPKEKKCLEADVGYNCKCDNACSDYGDCCLHALAYNRTTNIENVNKFECLRIASQKKRFYMKSKCMVGWPEDTTKERCGKTNIDLETYPLLVSPVTSAVTNITYNNIYCAVCNKETPTDILSWEADVQCYYPSHVDYTDYINVTEQYFLENVQLINGSLKLLLRNETKEQEFMECKFLPVVPEKVQSKVRECIDHVATCASNWTDKYYDWLCQSYTDIVYSDGKYFRNYHCAICNFVKTEHIRCNKKILKPLFRQPRFSLYVLFHFGGNETNCPIGNHFNMLSKKCYPAFCLEKNRQFRYGKCHKVTKNLENITFNVVNESLIAGGKKLFCNKFFINDTDFERLSNSMVYVKDFYQIYSEDQYENYERGILVCHYFKYATLERITYVGLAISSICILIHLIAFLFVPELRNLPGKNMASLCVSLLCLYTCFILANASENDYYMCFYLASIMYYFFIASFAWMNVMSFDIWMALNVAVTKLQVNSNKHWKKFIIYSLYAWMLPGCALLIVLVINHIEPPSLNQDYLPSLGNKFCWFGKKKAILIYFALPLAIIMTMNIFFFIMAAWTLKNATSSSRTLSTTRKNRGQLKVYVKLATLMGLTWITAVIAGYFQKEFLKYLCVFLNAFQGLYILFTYTLKKKVFNVLSGMKFFNLNFFRWNSTKTEISNLEFELPRTDTLLTKLGITSTFRTSTVAVPKIESSGSKLGTSPCLISVIIRPCD